ncbi:hypothetical protein [Modestobacter lapidis]|nr:hypothetical protein [Modestobacter lapidis]
MSKLAAAVTARLRDAVDEETVEAILTEARIPTSAAIPTPVGLQVLRVEFSGIKLLTGPTGDATDDDATAVDDATDDDRTGAGGSGAAVTTEPFTFSWTLGPGLHVVGSHENLRGKSTVLEVIRWGLRGRCRLQADVRSWLRHVQVVFAVGAERLRISFDVTDGRPDGAVHRESDAGTAVELVRFADEDAFIAAMDAVMMPRLHLQRIAAWQEGQAIEHAWVAYAGALSISSGGLDVLLGDTKFSGMPSRLLSMFLGAAWAAPRAEAATAVKAADAAVAALQSRSDEREAASAGRRERAVADVQAAKALLAELPDGEARLAEIDAAVRRVGSLGAEIAALSVQLEDLRATEREVGRQLQDERARKHAQLEDALGRRFFNALRPTACPRCAAPVTEARLAQEQRGHECSVCTTDLDIDAFTHEVLVSTAAPTEEREAALRSASLKTSFPAGADADVGEDVAEDDDDAAEAALQAALNVAALRAGRVAEDLREATRERGRVAALARSGQEIAGLLQRRRDAELALARAQGARDALAVDPTPGELAEREALERRRTVLAAAEKVTADWVREAQREALIGLSNHITALARAFGVAQLTSVELAGNASMKVRKGGADTSYTGCSPGEKLRLKVATAVALVHAGFDTQIGRHPGLLTVDSPGSEEATTESLDTMLHALDAAAAASPDMQIIIATTRTDLLEELVPAERRRIAPPGGYLW